MPHPDPARRLLAETLLSGASPDQIAAEFGPGPGEDDTLDLSLIPAGSDLSALRGRKILPTVAIRKYLATGDPLTHQAIDSMELAMEREFSISPPFFVTSVRDGKEGRDLRIRHFYLGAED